MGSEKKLAAVLMLFEYITAGVAIGLGWKILHGIGSSCTGFGFLGVTLVIFGVVIMILFYVGVATVDVAPEAALLKSVCCSVPVFIVMAAFGIFTLAVSTRGGGKSIDGTSYKEYHVGSYSKWMQNKVSNIHNWESYYKKAVVDENVCHKFGKDYRFDSLDAFHKRKLSPFKSSCCKPPEECSFNFTSPTIWVKPENGTYSNDDCNRWDNNPSTLCFDCESCKAAFLEDVTGVYFAVGIGLIILAAKELILGSCLIYLILDEDSSPSYNSLLV